MIGGWSWVVWGIFVRVSVTGHWLVGYFAHRQGGQSFVVGGAAAQGYSVALAGLDSMGEGWHTNHYAFPTWAKMGLHPGETDLGWWLIKSFERLVSPGTSRRRLIFPADASCAACSRQMACGRPCSKR